MKIACLQLDSLIGDFHGNVAKLLSSYEKAIAQGAELVLAPELFLSGYAARDLLTYRDFIAANARALEELAAKIGDIPLLVGTLTVNENRPGKPLYNSAAVLLEGRIAYVVHKALLPTYDVFDEDRYFEPGSGSEVFLYRGRRIGITICEDLWNDEDFWPDRRYRRDPVKPLSRQGMDLLVNLSASPWNLGKERLRHDMMSKVARDEGVPLVQVNMVGGNDELLFDGQSMVFNPRGEITALGTPFREDILVVDIDDPTPVHPKWPSDAEQLFYALSMGTHDYLTKCGFKKAVLGLSGGIDSAVTAAIAVDAMGPENVIGVAMPTKYSSKGSVDDAVALAANLEIELKTIPIQESFDHFLHVLEPSFAGKPVDITEENLQARIRGMTLMALSNKLGAMVLATGNKSELSTGYCTLYGDMNGGLAVLGDVLKLQVYDIARWLNRRAEIIPNSSITKAPSAELRPDQTDQDSLPPYEVLDKIIQAYIVDKKTMEEMLALGFDKALLDRVIRLIDNAEYKRHQSAKVLKVSPVSFGTGRRLQIVRGRYL